MVTEHTMEQAELDSIAYAFSIDLPDGPDAAHKAEADMLSALPVADFDTSYIGSQLRGHQVARDLFKREIDMGKNQRVIDYASKTLPHIELHHDLADSLWIKLQ